MSLLRFRVAIGVAKWRFVELAEEILLRFIDAIHLPISGLPHGGFGASKIGRQGLPIHRLLLPFDAHREGEAIGDDIVELMDGALAGDVLDVDDLLFGLREGMRLEAPDSFQVIPEVSAVRHQSFRIRFIHTLPPQIEKEEMVMKRGEVLLDFVFKRSGLQLFRIFRKPQIRVGPKAA